MEYYPFPALLRSRYNGVHEFGQAAIAADDNAVDFTSDFVPLLPLGTEAEIDWLLGNRCLASYQGNVYLSSKNLLRVTDVDPAMLEKARNTLAINTRLPASVVATGKDADQVSPRATRISAEILYLSDDTVKLRAAEYVSVGQRLLLSAEVDFLTLQNQPLRVRERVLIRRGEALSICDVLPGGDDNYVALTTYAAKLAKAAK